MENSPVKHSQPELLRTPEPLGRSHTDMLVYRVITKLSRQPIHYRRQSNLILEKHKMSRERIDLQSSVKHLQYLYWTYSLPPIGEKCQSLRKRSSFCVFEERNSQVHGNVDIYFQTGEKYGIQEFLRPALEEEVEGDLLGYFINPEYLNSAPTWSHGKIMNFSHGRPGWKNHSTSTTSRPKRSY